MRARAPSKLRTHVLWALVVLFVVFLHLRGRNLEHAATTRQRRPGLVILNTDSKRLTLDSSASGSETRLSNREHILAFVGVQTGFSAARPNKKYDYVRRRQQLRATWFPADSAARSRLEEQGVVARFVVGHSNDAAAEAAMQAEIAQHSDFLQLDITEAYLDLAKKSLAFFSAVTRLFDAEYIIKVDDDVYFRLQHMPHVVRQWKDLGAGYIGCMKTGAIMTDKKYRWYEPQHALLGSKSYFAHTWGSAYVLSGAAATLVTSLPMEQLRYFSNEDVTVGSWMLAFNVSHFDDRRMCSPSCEPNAVAVYDFPKCAGLCDSVEALPKLHRDEACRSEEPPQLVRQSWRFP